MWKKKHVLQFLDLCDVTRGAARMSTEASILAMGSKMLFSDYFMSFKMVIT